MRSTIKNNKSEMRQIMWDGTKWNTGSEYNYSMLNADVYLI